MSRIKSDNVQIGKAFIVPIEKVVEHVETAAERAQIESAEQKAKEIISNAQKDGAQLIADAKLQAQEEIAAATEKGRKEGFDVGRQQGLKSITEELSDKIEAVNDFAKGSFELKDEIIKSAKIDIVKLIIEISQKICTNAINIDEKIIKEITIKAISKLKDKEHINIIVNPEMAEKIYAISEEIKSRIPQLSSIKIIEDKSVSPDGTIVESPMTRVDDRICAQIGEIAKEMMNETNSTKDIFLQEETEFKKEDIHSKNQTDE